jgi:hypothetical protein
MIENMLLQALLVSPVLALSAVILSSDDGPDSFFRA